MFEFPGLPAELNCLIDEFLQGQYKAEHRKKFDIFYELKSKVPRYRNSLRKNQDFGRYRLKYSTNGQFWFYHSLANDWICSGKLRPTIDEQLAISKQARGQCLSSPGCQPNLTA